MIVSISGVKGSGKSTVAGYLTEEGYQVVSFADKLKDLLSKIYGWSLESLNTQEGKNSLLREPVLWTPGSASYLEYLLSLPTELYCPKPVKVLTTRREALQFVGTEVLRGYDPDFHVHDVRSRLRPGVDYVIDDCRFRNEKAMLEGQEALCIYIIKPGVEDTTGHVSESSLSAEDFEHILVNDSTVEAIIEELKLLISSHEHKVKSSRIYL
jgi:hypothetical protein